MKFVHITDPHLVAPSELLWGMDPCDRLSRCLDDVARVHGDADFCVISGDLADSGAAAAYNWLAERLHRFPIKTRLMIGNHDRREAFQKAFPDEPSCQGGFVQQSFTTEQGVFILLDTHKIDATEGQFCEARCIWLREQLERAGAAPVFLFMHHPPFDVGIPHMDRVKLEDAEAFADVISAGQNIRHIFFGHIHRASYFSWRGIPLTSLPGTNHQVALVRDSVGTAYSHEPGMYGVVVLEDERVSVHFDAFANREPVPGT